MMKLWGSSSRNCKMGQARHVEALVSPAHQARLVVAPRGHVLSTFTLPGTMLPGNSISDACDSHVARVLAMEKAKLVVRYNLIEDRRIVECCL